MNVELPAVAWLSFVFDDGHDIELIPLRTKLTVAALKQLDASMKSSTPWLSAFDARLTALEART